MATDRCSSPRCRRRSYRGYPHHRGTACSRRRRYKGWWDCPLDEPQVVGAANLASIRRTVETKTRCIPAGFIRWFRVMNWNWNCYRWLSITSREPSTFSSSGLVFID
jgi:hypothetical protein